MKKPKKKKRRPTQAFSGEVSVDPLEIIILDQPAELQMIFSFSNRAIKMIKSGRTLERVFLKDGKQCRLMFMHRDIYDETHRSMIEMKQRHLVEKAKQAKEKKAEDAKGLESEESKIE